MTNSNIITNQFVRINQTPASIGERVLARILDTIFISFGFTGVYLLFDALMGEHGRNTLAHVLILYACHIYLDV